MKCNPVKIYTKLEYLWIKDKYVLVHADGHYLPAGSPVSLCKGASSQQDALAASQTDFYNTMTQDYKQQFADQNAILNTLDTSLKPIVEAGPNQYGFSTGETNDLNSQAIEGTAKQFNQAQRALQQQQAAAGGGNQYLPSGVNEQQKAELASAGANQESSELLGIKQAGYTQGANQYQSAIQQEEAAAKIYSPTEYSSSATGAGTAAANEANTISQENNAASPLSVLGGILGGATTAFAGGLGGAVGKKL